jgi:Acetyltransferase (GNAT) domain
MLIGTHITIGPLVPEDLAPLFCWANDTAAARLDFAYRPIDMMTHRQLWDAIGKDPTKVVFAIRKIDTPVIIGYVQITGINTTHRSAEIGIRIGAEQNRNHGFGKRRCGLPSISAGTISISIASSSLSSSTIIARFAPIGPQASRKKACCARRPSLAANGSMSSPWLSCGRRQNIAANTKCSRYARLATRPAL